MKVFDFIAGVALGAFHIPKENINKNLGFEWFKECDCWTLHIHHYRTFTLEELTNGMSIVQSFCDCKNLFIGSGVIKIEVVIEEGGDE